MSKSARDPRRSFSAKERAALCILADGHCSNCGAPLHVGFHADHITPWSAGGQTDVLNGAAMCPRCNHLKAAKPAAPDRAPGDLS